MFAQGQGSPLRSRQGGCGVHTINPDPLIISGGSTSPSEGYQRTTALNLSL